MESGDTTNSVAAATNAPGYKGRVKAILVVAVVWAAAPKSSEKFVELARAVGRDVLSSEMKASCDKLDEESKELCRDLVPPLVDLFQAAASQKIDADDLENAAKTLGSRVAQAALLHAVEGQLGVSYSDAIVDVAKTPGATCSNAAARVDRQLVACARRTLFGGGNAEVCERMTASVEAAADACGLPFAASPPATGKEAVELLADWIQTEKFEAKLSEGQRDLLAILLRSAADTQENGNGTWPMAIAFEERLARALVSSESIGGLPAFREDTSLLRDLRASTCAGAPALASTLTDWEGRRRAAFFAVKKLSAFSAEPNLASIGVPDGSPFVGFACSTDSRLESRVREKGRSFADLAGDLTLDRNIDRLAWVLLPAAATVDFILTSDRVALRSALESIGLRALERGLLVGRSRAFECADVKQEGRVVSFACQAFGAESGASPQTWTISAADMARYGRDPGGVVNKWVEKFSARAARRDCTWQVVAAALGQDSAARQGADELCVAGDAFGVMPESQLRALGLEDAPGFPPEFGVRRWKPRSLSMIRANPWGENRVTRQDAQRSISAILRELVAQAPNRDDLEALEFIVEASMALVDGREDEALQLLASGGAALLWPQIEILLDKAIVSADACEKKPSSARCVTRALAVALVDPVVEFVLDPDPDESAREGLADRVMVAIAKADPLSRSPVLLNVGLAATGTTPEWKRDDPQVHLTVLEKVGFAWRFGPRNSAELGLFAGGFVDPVIQELSGQPLEDPRFLVGLALGTRQLTKRYPLGIEAHVGAAVSRDLTRSDATVPAFGLTLLVPIEYLLE